MIRPFKRNSQLDPDLITNEFFSDLKIALETVDLEILSESLVLKKKFQFQKIHFEFLKNNV